MTHSGVQRLFVAVVACVLLAGVVPVSVARAGGPLPSNVSLATLRTLVLNRSDVPAGFQATTPTILTNARAATADNVPVSVLVAHGRILGYQSQFGTFAKTGIVVISSVVTAYTTPAGAHWDFVAALHRDLTTPYQGAYLHQVAAPRVGDESAVLTISLKSSPTTLYGLLFRQGRFSVLIAAGGFTGTFSSSQVIHYARIVEDRIKRLGTGK